MRDDPWHAIDSEEKVSRDQLIADFWRETSGYPPVPGAGKSAPKVVEPGEEVSAVIEPLSSIRAVVNRLERSERRLRDSRKREVILEEALRQAYDAAEYMRWDLPAAIAAKKEEQDG